VENSYVSSTDGAVMIEIAPHQFVNEKVARDLGMVRRAEERRRMGREPT
jgi:hypothetical protein